MAPAIKIALLMGAIAGLVSANPVAETTSSTITDTARPCTSTSKALIWGADAPQNFPNVLTYTSYTASVTKHVEVDCGGCRYLTVQPNIVGRPRPGGARPHVAAVKTMAGTTTVTRAYCSASPVLNPREIGERDTAAWNGEQGAPEERVADAAATGAPGCTTRVFHVPRWTFGPTETRWTTTVTKTSEVDCGHCTALETIPINLGIGPVIFFNATVTATTPFYATTTVCSTKH